MAIVKKSVTTGTSNGATSSVSVTTSESPSATAVGDLVVVIYGNNYYALSAMGTPSATGSPTMNAIASAVADAGANNAHIKAYWYVANTAGAQTITATETGPADEEKYLTAYVLSGADTTTPVEAAASGFSATSVTPNPAPAVSPTSDDAYVIAITSTGGGASTPSYTTPAPLTEDGEIHVGGLSGVYGSAQLSASGSTGAFNFTPEDGKAYGAITIAIATASGGGSVSGVAVAAFGPSGAVSGIRRVLSTAASLFGGSLEVAGVARTLGQATASFGGAYAASGGGRTVGTASASFGGTFSAQSSQWGPQLEAGVRAGAGTVGFRGDTGALTVLNPGGSLAGTVFEGTGTSWDGDALLVAGTDLVVEGYEINGSVTHTSGANLTIKHCIINTPQGQLWCVSAENPSQGTLTIEDTTIVGTPGPGTTVVGSGVGGDCRRVLRRLDISGVGDHIHANGYQGTGFTDSTIVSQCYLHDGTYLDDSPDGQHADYIQCNNNNSGYTSDSGQTYLLIEHCATDITVGPSGVAYSSGITAGHTTGGASEFSGPHMSLKVDNCYLPAGAYHLRLQARLNNCVVTNNNFGYRNSANGEFGLASVDAFPASTITWTNNVDGNGDPYTYGDPGPEASATQAVASLGGTFAAQGVSRALGVAATSLGFTTTATGTVTAREPVTGTAAAAFGGAFAAAGIATTSGVATGVFGGTFTAAQAPPPVYIFTPPTVPQGSTDPFFGRYSIPVGVSVVKRSGVFERRPFPALAEIASLEEGVEWFQGGRTYEVSSALALELEASGFETALA